MFQSDCMAPQKMRSTIFGFTMLSINVFAFAIGNVVVGVVADHFIEAGATAPLTGVLIATDVLAISSALFFALAARATGRQRAAAMENIQPAR